MAGKTTVWHTLVLRLRNGDRWKLLGLLVPGVVVSVLFQLSPTSSSTGAALLIDTVCLLLSITTLLGAAALLVAAEANAAIWTAVACLTSGLLAVGVLATTYAPATSADLRVVGLAVVVLVLTFVGWHRVGLRWTGIRLSATRITVAVLTVAALPVFTFWQETTYLPSQLKVSLSADLSATALEATDGTLHWRVSGSVQNTSEVRASTVISALIACQWASEAERGELSREDRCTPLPQPVRRGWIDGKSELDFSDSVVLDPRTPLLELRFRIAFARGDRLREVTDSERDADPEESGSCSNGKVVELQATSRLRALALEPSFLMFADADGDGDLNYFIAAKSDLRCPVRGDQAREDYYSVAEFGTSWVGWQTAAEGDDPDGTP